MIAGEGAVMLGTKTRDASDAKAKAQEELGWTLRYPAGAKASQPPTASPNRSPSDTQPPTGCRHPRRVRARRAALLGSRRLDCFRKSER